MISIGNLHLELEKRFEQKDAAAIYEAIIYEGARRQIPIEKLIFSSGEVITAYKIAVLLESLRHLGYPSQYEANIGDLGLRALGLDMIEKIQ